MDVEAFVRTLESHGFRYAVDGKAVDLVVVDQQSGPAVDGAEQGLGTGR